MCSIPLLHYLEDKDVLSVLVGFFISWGGSYGLLGVNFFINVLLNKEHILIQLCHIAKKGMLYLITYSTYFI